MCSGNKTSFELFEKVVVVGTGQFFIEPSNGSPVSFPKTVMAR